MDTLKLKKNIEEKRKELIPIETNKENSKIETLIFREKETKECLFEFKYKKYSFKTFRAIMNFPTAIQINKIIPYIFFDEITNKNMMVLHCYKKHLNRKNVDFNYQYDELLTRIRSKQKLPDLRCSNKNCNISLLTIKNLNKIKSFNIQNEIIYDNDINLDNRILKGKHTFIKTKVLPELEEKKLIITKNSTYAINEKYFLSIFNNNTNLKLSKQDINTIYKVFRKYVLRRYDIDSFEDLYNQIYLDISYYNKDEILDLLKIERISSNVIKYFEEIKETQEKIKQYYALNRKNFISFFRYL